MVGVPRSSSCRECLQRRVKCDRTYPACSRCQTRGVRCPGYRRALRFYNQTTGNNDFTDARQYGKLQEAKNNHRSSSSTFTSSRSLTSTSTSRPTIDEILAPNLVCKALDTQTKEVFEYVVKATFPLTFSTFAPRLEPNWVQFIRHHQAAQSEPIAKAIRCLNLWYLGVKNSDPLIVEHSRAMYSRALRCLARLVGHPRTRKSDTTLAAAIMLAVFEMLDPVTPHSWLIHSRGIAALCQERGARVHSAGFPRTMFVTIRSFLLADAFVRREPSFLSDAEWRFANQEAAVFEYRAGRGSWIGKIVDLVFNEITLGAGFLAETTVLITGDKGDEVAREELVERIQTSRGVLRNLQAQLASVCGVEGKLREMEEKRSDPGGRLATEHVSAVAGRSLQGLCAGLALLDQLLVLLEADKKRGRIRQGAGSAGSVWGRVPVPTATLEGPFSGDDRPMDWLDQISMSMGTLAISNT